MKNWKFLIRDKKFLLHLCISLVVFMSAIQFSNNQSEAIDKLNSPTLRDALLENLPFFKESLLFSVFSIIVWLFLLLYHFTIPQKLPFLLFSFAVFFTLRSCFISLTHMGPPSGGILNQSFLSFNAYNSDLFFSGHTGFPFFLACLTSDKKMKYFCFGLSIVMGIGVLLFRLHYSIDVFAAFFIAHSTSVFIKNYLTKLTGIKPDYSL